MQSGGGLVTVLPSWFALAGLLPAVGSLHGKLSGLLSCLRCHPRVSAALACLPLLLQQPCAGQMFPILDHAC